MPGDDNEPVAEPKVEENKDKENRVPLQLSAGTIVKSRWKLTSKIGQGAFGETYGGYDMNNPEGQQVAIKVERWDNKKIVLKLEVMALKKLQPSPYVVRYISSGRQDDFNFLVMERLGENLAELRKKTACGFFSLGTTLKLGVQMLEAIEECHNLSYIHRDIKPSNFVIGKTEEKRRRCFLIDFGLARKYRITGGVIRPARKSAGFRGTARYASVHSHQSKELSRRDDLWSLFYVLIEFASGSLPWRRVKDKDQIGELKEKYTNRDLVKNLPRSFGFFMEHLQGLDYPTNPDYSYLRSLLQSLLDQEGVVAETPYDWEAGNTWATNSPKTTAATPLHQPNPPKAHNSPHRDGAESAGPESGKEAEQANGKPEHRTPSREPAEAESGKEEPKADTPSVGMRMQSKEDEATKEPTREPTKTQDGADTKEKEGAEVRQSAGDRPNDAAAGGNKDQGAIGGNGDVEKSTEAGTAGNKEQQSVKAGHDRKLSGDPAASNQLSADGGKEEKNPKMAGSPGDKKNKQNCKCLLM
mmetsp:Transcript_4867/g.8866  ORF Transcript_4867/g.8866 Transcript_4867/m.8866 type:complete len:527 (-) Transcript_4867:883-2463(-)